MSEEKSKSRNLIEGMLIYAIGNFGSKIEASSECVSR